MSLNTDILSVINEKDLYENDLTSYVSVLQKRGDPTKLDELAGFRDFKRSTIDEAGIFYIGDMAEMLIPSFIEKLDNLGVISETNKKPIFRERWVMPIKNEKGNVQNLVGYSPYFNERYIYGTSKYYRRRETLYGLENLEMAYDLGYAFLTEGITDTIRLRDLGFKNSFAMCGTHTSPYVINQLNRCKHGVIMFPDRDDAGIKAHKAWQFNRSVTIYINFQFKDVDGMCKNSQENKEILLEYIEACKNYILSEEHQGKQYPRESVTIQ